jgi:putative heme transporter
VAEGGVVSRHRRALLGAVWVAAAVGFLYFVVPQLAGLGETLHRLRAGNPLWLALGVLLECLSIAGYIAVFHGVFSCAEARIGWRASYQITLAGTVTSKLLATAGAGGIALTVWALRASGLGSDTVARRMVAFEIVNYAVYMIALVVAGLGLWTGLFAGRSPFGLTVVPALFGAAVIALALSMLFVARPAEGYLLKHADTAGVRTAQGLRRAATFPRAIEGGLRTALQLIRGRNVWLIGAVAAWGFDIGTLWAAFHAFGHSPPGAVLVMSYFVGTLADVLPLPGGIGGVEGGMIGSFLAFGVNGSLAVLAVLAYRTVSYWLPTLPGAAAYLPLRRTVAGWREQTSREKAAPPDASAPPLSEAGGA